ncbi:MAG: DNA topoisomerase IV, partial [Kocuria sp.]|nr:DNA topoisomerase IV [Kocuria sp.]
ACHASNDDNLVFITREAKLLTFDAAKVRPQGKSAGGVAGIKVAESDRVIYFGALSPTESAVVVTVSEAEESLPGTEAGSAKITEFGEYPAKGRATGGVRAHRFLKGESGLKLAWAGRGPAKAVSAAGVARSLPTEFGARDGSGVPLSQSIDAIGPALGSGAEDGAVRDDADDTVDA